MSKRRHLCVCNDSDVETHCIVVNKTNSNFSRAAVKLLLDNIVAPEEIENIFKTENKLKNEAEANIECEFCKKKCPRCQLCCSGKGLQLYLLNKALEKIKCIPRRCRGILCRSSSGLKCDENCTGECSKRCSMLSKFNIKQSTFKEIRSKLNNLKKYYPYIYKFQGNIMEEWGRNEMLSKIRPDILKFNSKDCSIFWI